MGLDACRANKRSMLITDLHISGADRIHAVQLKHDVTNSFKKLYFYQISTVK